MKRIVILIMALVAVLPLPAENIESSSVKMLEELNKTLKEEYLGWSKTQQRFMTTFERTHQEMSQAVGQYEDLLLRFFDQDPQFTFTLSWTLKAVTQQAARFPEIKTEYDNLFYKLNVEIDRYERLITLLEQRPIPPDKEPLREACLAYAHFLLENNRSLYGTLAADYQYFESAILRLNEADVFADERYKQLEKYVFTDRQTSWSDIAAAPSLFLRQVFDDCHFQYGQLDLRSRFYAGLHIALVFVLLCLSGILAVRLSTRFFSFTRKLNRSRRILSGILVGCALFLLIYYCWTPSYDILLPILLRMFKNFVWLLAIILTALLCRVEAPRLRDTIRLYVPTLITALTVLVSRLCFIPDTLLALVLPIVLVVVIGWLLSVCKRSRKRVDRFDLIVARVSYAVAAASLVVDILGFTFVALLMITWWYIQLAIILAVQCITFYLRLYKERRLDPTIDKYLDRLSNLTGLKKGSLLFGFTWFYDLVVGVILPMLALLSVPFCLRLTMDVFEFDMIYDTIFHQPFISLTDHNGADILKISLHLIIWLACLFLIFRYLDKLIHYCWLGCRYRQFCRQTKRTRIRMNELNLSLDNSIISVLVWMTYIVIAFVMLRIPISSLGLVAGGFSAGIGIALKDTINNFMHGIQLMNGRMRVGDIIEIDGIRGGVSEIGYQYTKIKTPDGKSIYFDNNKFFSNNFTNLSKGSSYEFVRIPIVVNFGTDIDKVRQLVTEAVTSLNNKDKYDRDILNPNFGVRVMVSSFEKYGVKIIVSQQVLVEEMAVFVPRATEVIYNTLVSNDIEIATSKD